MSTLEEQIKALQFQKSKAELFKKILIGIADMQVSDDLKEAYDEVFLEVNDFVKEKIDGIENRKEASTQTNSAEAIFSPEEMEVLKMMIARAQQITMGPQNPTTGGGPGIQTAVSNRGAFSDEEAPVPQKKINPNAPKREAVQDKIRFAMNNRHLDNKRVTVQTKNGPALGKVVGLDAPHVVVKMDAGPTISVDLENVTLEN